jgi:hypothetical protein
MFSHPARHTERKHEIIVIVLSPRGIAVVRRFGVNLDAKVEQILSQGERCLAPLQGLVRIA